MRQAPVWLAAVGAFAGASRPAHGWHVDAVFRWRSTIGDDFFPHQPFYADPGNTLTFRVQIRLIDDDDGPVPAGGLLGWTMGTLDGGGTNGAGSQRLIPFNSTPPPGFAGTQTPLALTDITATLGTQTPIWRGVPGTDDPGPPPSPVVRGLNTFVSVFQFVTIAGESDYSLNAGGAAVTASSWEIVGTPVPPQTGPDHIFGTPDDVAGSITYAPVALEGVPFTATRMVIIPAPAGAVAIALCTMIVMGRRRPSGRAEGDVPCDSRL